MDFEDLYHLSEAESLRRFGGQTARRLREAWEDFNAVLDCKRPVHAQPDLETPRPTDGGTSFYLGDGYKLTVVMSLNGIMRGEEYVSGYIYGPIIRFEASVMVGNFPSLQSLSFYPEMTLRRNLAANG